jgi:lipid-A-disaccharide synthase
MVNLVAGRRVVPELMQGEMTGERLAAEARRLLSDGRAREEMRAGLAEVARQLAGDGDAMSRAAAVIEELTEGKVTHVS